ncbi:MAG: glycosyltransferase [Candidatus Omnitrophota bacterium]
MAVDMRASVIIPVYNGQATIAAAIEAVLAQCYSSAIELVVVDDGSTDGTRDIVTRYAQVRYVYQANTGPAGARNRGAREAGGDILFFTDADCRPQPGWIARMAREFSDPDIAVVAGSYGIANPDAWLAAAIHAEIIYRHKMLMPRYPRFFGSYNFAVRRAVFESAGGFNAGYRQASGEDNDLSYRISAHGGRISFLADVCVDHYHQEWPWRYLREQFRHGYWRVKMYADHPRMMGGDGYTFWKDAAEVPCVLLHGVLFVWPWALPAGFLFFVFEAVFGVYIMRSFKSGMAAGGMMWLRAFARTAGFVAGGIYLSGKTFSSLKKV